MLQCHVLWRARVVNIQSVPTVSYAILTPLVESAHPSIVVRVGQMPQRVVQFLVRVAVQVIVRAVRSVSRRLLVTRLNHSFVGQHSMMQMICVRLPVPVAKVLNAPVTKVVLRIHFVTKTGRMRLSHQPSHLFQRYLRILISVEVATTTLHRLARFRARLDRLRNVQMI